jgi:endo-1,4-beta-mannosidase
MARFLLGVNYWPSHSAMYMWKRFDIGEIREDAAHMRALGFDLVRFFLLWEDFAPEIDALDDTALKQFDAVMAVFADCGLRAIPTLFCGHMSGVNWLPRWSLSKTVPHGRFRTISAGVQAPYGIGDFYRDDRLVGAQLLLARALGRRVAGHPALHAWDIGNEFSNMGQPHTPEDAAFWSATLAAALLESSGAPSTAGMHGEDFEHDRHIRPSTLAKPLAFATMHGYSVYSVFSRGRLDTEVVPFLCRLMQSFARKPVLFSEFGNPECPPNQRSAGSVACLGEEEMVSYASSVLARLVGIGAIGAMWWCWTDYDPKLASLPPFDEAPHELRFGMVRSDGTEKPIAQALARFASEEHPLCPPAPTIADEHEYFASLPQGVFEIYKEYCQSNT